MTNERIDLSQFEEITHGNWSVIRNGGRIDIGVGDSYSYAPIVTFTDSLAEVVMKIDRDVADMNAIAAAPKLISELKRCYSLIDDLQEESILMLALEEVAEFADMFCTKCRTVDGMSDHICGEPSE
jgi:hypothetical protein